MERKTQLKLTIYSALVAIFYLLQKTEGAVDLSYEILGRPDAVRPIPGESIRFTCAVEDSLALRWRSSNFTNELLYLGVDDVGDERADLPTNSMAVLTENSGENLSSVLTFSSVEASVLNNTVVECVDYNEQRSSNFTIVMAGIPSPPVEPLHFNNTCLCANISWFTPEFDGTAPITSFTITLTLPEHTLPNSSVAVERVEIADGNATQIDVCDLRPNAVYNTTITSNNDVGSSRAEEFVIFISAIEPYPAENVVAKPVCSNHRQCLFNDSDHLLVTWDLPELNTYLLCPVEQIWLNYSFIELEVDMQSFQVTSPNISVTDTAFEIRPVMPGTTYNVTVTFVNQVGESEDNIVAMVDVLLFQNYLVQKQVAPSAIQEGGQAYYSVRLDGPPPNDVAITVNSADPLSRVERPMMFESLVFNTDNWFVAQDILVSAIDDNVILESPYGSLLRVVALDEMVDVNITLLVNEADQVDIIIIPRETYPSFRNIPEGRWSVFNITLPNQPYYNVTITFNPVNPTIYLSHTEMIFQPANWDVPQILTVFATEDDVNAPFSPYVASFNMSLTSRDHNYDGAEIEDFDVSIEDNDEDSAVLAGALTWTKADQENRTTAKFMLTLSLSYSDYQSATVGDQLIVTGATIDYGDGDTLEDPVPMKVLVVNEEEEYIIVTSHILHTYSTTSIDDRPWEAVFQYCCRAQDIRNGPETRMILRVDVDLTYTSSPIVPSLPPITLRHLQGVQGFFFTGVHPNYHPLTFSLGGMFDYQSSQAATPQPVDISHSTGHVTFDMDHLTPGDYSIVIVVEDTISGIMVVSSLLLRVTPAEFDNDLPAIVPPHPLLPPPPLIFSTTDTNHTLSVRDEDTIMAAEVYLISELPDGAEASNLKLRGDKTGEVLLSWTPSEEQTGVYIACFIAKDMYSSPSTPYCVPLVATIEDEQLPSIDLNGPLTNDLVYTATYTKGIDNTVPIASSDAMISLSSYGIHYMSIAFANSLDGMDELITFDDSFQPSISYHYTQPQSTSDPSVLVFEGTATPGVYSEILRNLRYENKKGRPAVGDRLLYIVISDSKMANDYTESYVTIDVSIHDFAPVLSVSGSDEAFQGLFLPFEGPVPAISPFDAFVIDTDSEGIIGATLQLGNVQDGPYEVLSVTYRSPERLSLPVIAEALDLDIPFGILWDGEEAPVISSTIIINEGDSLAVVGEVKVVVDVRHSWIGDLNIELEHNSLRKQLVLNPGGRTCQKDDLFLATFSSYYNSQVNPPSLSRANGSPGLCVLRSQGVFSTDGDIEFFHGMSIDGEWILHIMDSVADEYSGRLVGWSLQIQPLESHLIESYPPVLPPLTVSGGSVYEERHVKEVSSDGQINTMAVHVHLGVPYTAEFAFLPSLVLIHPDGTQVTLAHGIDNLCTRGNFTHLIFDDRAESNHYSCYSVLHPRPSESGSSSGSGFETYSGMESGNASQSISSSESGSGSFSEASGIGSGSGWIYNPENTITFDEAVENITVFPMKWSMIDLVAPTTPLHHLKGKRIDGKWTLVLSSQHSLESTLYDWSLRIAREPNIDESYDESQNILSLSGLDSPTNYQHVLRSIVYENRALDYEFLTQRTVTTTLFDGELYSDSTANASMSYITLHHIVIDLDPNDISNASTPDFSITFVEHSSSIDILDHQNAILTDPTFSEGLYTLKITLTDYQNFNEENLTVDIFLPLRAEYENDIVNGEFTVTVTSINSTSQPIELFEAVMRTVEYHNFAEEFVGFSRIVTFLVTDAAGGSQFTSRVASAHIILRPTNDFPILQLNAYQYGLGSVFSNVVEYKEGQGEVLLANESSVSLTDNDHNTLDSVAIMIENAQDGKMEILSVETLGYNIVPQYNATSNILLLSGVDTLDNYALVLGTVSYNNTYHSPGQPGTDPRYISFVPFDGTHKGPKATVLVTFSAVNDAPFGDLNGPAPGINFMTTFIEETGPTNISSSNLMLFDTDNVTLSFITVRITNNLDGDFETLSVMDVIEQTDPNSKTSVLTFLRPETEYDYSSATLTISGLDSVREYVEVLKTLTYNNRADEPSPETRLLEIILNDGYLDGEPLYVSLDIELVNDSPYFDPSQPAYEPEIFEDIPEGENLGASVTEISYLIIDDDVGATKGIAVIGLDARYGLWEFSLDDGNSWTQIESVTQSFALVLDAIPDQKVRFLPIQNFNGKVEMTIVAWDGSNETVTAGSYTDATSQSETDPFSSESLTIYLTVIPVNDAPVLTEIPLNATSILEDDYNSTGDSILSLLIHAGDIDNDNELGIAVIEADQENGVWEFTQNGGESWESFGFVSFETALVLRSLPEEENRVRFVPNLDYNGFVSLQFVVWDLNRLPEDEMTSSAIGSGVEIITSTSGSGSTNLSISGSAMVSNGGSGSGSAYVSSETGVGHSTMVPVSENVTLPDPYPTGSYINTTLSDPVTGPFSVNSTSVTLWVEPVNDSPIILPGMTLDDITEDTWEEMNHGTKVSVIIDGFYSDVDDNHNKGIAVIEVDNRFGLWQYTCNTPPLSWEPFIGDILYGETVPPLPLEDKATLLRSSCWIRYLPSANFNNELDMDGYPRPESDAPFIRVLGWDNTGRTHNRSGTYGNDATYANESHINEYSENSEQVFITVISVNDKPVLGLTSATEPNYSTVFEEDHYPVEITGHGLSLVDVDHARLRDVTVTLYGSIYDQLPPSLANIGFGVSVSGDYIPRSGSGSGAVQSSASGSGSGVSSGYNFGEDAPSNESIRPPFVPMVSSAPLYLPPLHRVREFVENLTNPSYLERYCAGLEPRREELFIDVSKWDLDYVILSWCPFTLYIYADPHYANDAPVDQFRLALRTLQYNNSINEPEGGNRIITFVVSDNFDTSDAVNATVTVMNINDYPVLDLNIHLPTFNNFVSYTEGQGPLLLANESLSLIDHDDMYLQEVRIVLQNAPNEDHEILAADTNNTSIIAEYQNYTLILTGNATIDVYQEVLATVTYNNTYSHPGNPAEIQREVYFYVSDGKMDSDPAIAYISFTAVNNRPHIFVGRDNYTVNFYEEKGPVLVVDPVNLLLHDEDNSSVAFVTARILNNLEGIKEYLTAVNDTYYDTVYDGEDSVIRTYLTPNVTYNYETAELYITGLDSIEEYEHILRTIQYNNVADEPINDTRIIEFIANDGLLDSFPAYMEVNILPENDSPRFNESVSIMSDSILEDDRENEGITVFEVAYFIIEDDDYLDERGIAITEIDTENGAWEYRLESTSNWVRIRHDTNITTALLLRADLEFENSIRFLPNQDFYGTATLTFLPWDATDNLPDGTTRVAISRSDLDSFGIETMDFIVQVIPVNDAPVLSQSIEPDMTPILEDDVWERESDGDDISRFLTALNHDVDDLTREDEYGIAIIAVDNSNGYWEVSVNGGMNWTDILSPSSTSAVVMRSQPEDMNRIRFVPNPDFNGRSSFRFLLWDLNETWPTYEDIDTTVQHPVTGTFSTEHTTAHIEVEPVNDSPVLAENGGITLSRIREDTNPSLNFGTTVNVILTDHFSDIDGLGVGVAVVHVDERHGRWWYTCQTGSDQEWSQFIGGRINYETEEGTVSQISPLKPNEFAATLLDEICSIRFIPDEHFNTEYNYDGSARDPSDTPYITIRGWDQTEGTNMQITVNTSTVPDNHTDAFSEEVFRATIEVVHHVDPPVLELNGDNGDNYEATFVEPIPPERDIIPVSVVNTAELRLTDPDNASISYASIRFGLFDAGSESLNVNVSGTSLMATHFVNLDVYSVAILPAGGALSAPIEEFQNVLRTLTYQNVDEEPNPSDRIITFLVHDGLTGSEIRICTLSVRNINDPPELDLNVHLSGTFAIVGYREGEEPTPLLNPLVVDLIDHDTELLDHAWVNITNPYDMRYELLAVDSPSPNITSTLNDSVLYLQGPASVREFRNVIASITYENTFSEPGDPSGLNRTIEFVVNDGIDDSIPAIVYLLFTVVNNAPILDLNGGLDGNDYSTVLYEEQGPVSAVSQSLTIQDIDNETLAYINVEIANPRDGGSQERLWVEDVTVIVPAETDTAHVTYTTYRPAQYYNESTATLTISGLESVEEYQLVLKTLKYDNLADEPHSETRELYVTVSDGLLDVTAVSYVEIINVNDSPFIDEFAIPFTSRIDEDVHDFENPGWAVEDIVAGLILDDDAEFKEGIAITAVDTSNGYWEIAWDYSTDGKTYGSGSISGSGETSVSGDSSTEGSGNNTVSGSENTSSSDVISNFGSGVPDSFSGSVAGGSGSTSGGGYTSSGSGSAYLGSASGSGIGPTDPEPTGPKCRPSVRSEAVPQPVYSATWHRVLSDTSLTQAVLLSSNGQRNRVRFVPKRDFNGKVDFSFVAWDTTDGAEDGSLANATSISLIDPFSSKTVNIEITVDPVNDAPLIPPESFLTLTSILEDDYFSVGDDVWDLTTIITDVDASDIDFGVAIVEADEDNGQWEITTDGGDSWTPIVSVCPYNATVLSSLPNGENRIRFVPDRDFNGNASFIILAWDLTSSDLESGDLSVDITRADIVTGPFSIVSATVTITVEPVNDSPVLSPGSHLNSIPEDIPVGQNAGTLVSDIVSGYYYDVDVGAETGIAVVGVDLRYGIWQYWCPNSDWQTFIGDLLYGMYVVPPNPQVDRATILGGNCRVRFLPDEHFNTLRDIDGYLRPSSDTPYITIRAWDNTGISEGLSGEYGVDTRYNTESIINEFSSETEITTVEVVSVNDVPVIRIADDGDGTRLEVNYKENQEYVRLVEPHHVSLTDIDHAKLKSVTVSVTNSLDGIAEVIRLEVFNASFPVTLNETTNIAYVMFDGTTEKVFLSHNTFSYNVSSLTLSAPEDGESVSIEVCEELLRHVVYTNLLEEPLNETRIIRFYINDSEDVNSMAETSVVFELLNEHTPVINDSLQNIVFAEDTVGPVPITSNDLTVTDIDHNEYFFIENATISISPLPENSDERVFVNFTDEFSLNQSYDHLSGILSIIGRAPPSVYQTVLQTAMYENTIEETRPGVREIAFLVFDGSYYSLEHIVRVDIVLQNDQVPVITTFNETFEFVEHSIPLSLNTNLAVTDADSGVEFQVLERITINITNAYDEVEELLEVTEHGNVSAVCDGQCNILILHGPAPISDFQTTLTSLTYINVAEEPTPGLRYISIQADDGTHTSEIEYISLEVVLVNDIPVLDLNGPLLPGRSSAVNYIEGQGEVLLTPNFTLSDNDHQLLERFVVTILNAPDGKSEVLALTYMYEMNLTNTSSTNDTILDLFNITVDYNSSLNVLTLSGISNLSNYETLLQTLTYDNYEAMPGFPNTAVRMIEFLAYDDTGVSNATLAYVTFHSVNDSAIVDLNGAAEGEHSVEFIEEGEAVPITTPDLVLMDVDNQFLAYVEVSITNLIDGDYEVLYVNDSFPDDDSLITTYIGGTLMISGLGLVENFREALASVMYNNFKDEPDYTPRVISVVANDGQLDSIPQYVTVNITPVNDPPRLFIRGLYNPPPPTVEPPTSSGVGSGLSRSGSGSGTGMNLGSGDLSGSGSGLGVYSSGSGMDDGSQSGSGAVFSGYSSGSATISSGKGIDISGSGSDSESNLGMRLKRQSDPNDDTTFNEEVHYSVVYPENSVPISIVNRSEVTVEDDDDLTLTHLEIKLNSIRDPGYETIFFDINLLRADLVSELGAAGAISTIGDGSTCPPGLPFQNELELLDIIIEDGLSLADWEEVIRSIKYCHSDDDPVNGLRDVSFRIQDPSGAWSNTVYAFIEVVAENDPPLCRDTLTTYNILEDEAITIPGLDRCFDHEEILNETSVIIYTAPLLGSAEVLPSGNILYSPHANLYGLEFFAYIVCDSEGFCSEIQNVSIDIASVNDAPYPKDDLVLYILEDVETLVDFSDFFGDYEDDLVPNSPYPEVQDTTILSPFGSISRFNDSSTSYNVDPIINYFGNGSIQLEVCDSEQVCITIILQVVLVPVNDVPTFETPPEGSPELVTVEDTPLIIKISVFDVEDRSELNVSFASARNGTGFAEYSNVTYSTVPAPGASDLFQQTMHIVYTPNTNFDGTDYVTVSAVDSEGGYGEVTFSVEVRYVNDPPQFGLTQLLVFEDVVTQFPLPSSLEIVDPEQELHAGSFAIIELPQFGELNYTFNETYLASTGEYPSEGYLIYSPPEHFFTSDNETVTFVLQACDNDTMMTPLCSEVEVHIVIESVNDAPHLPVVFQSVYEDRVLTFNLSDFTSDVEDGKPALPDIFLIEPYPTKGIAVYDNTTGFLTYTPFYNVFGEDVVHYNACDSENHCSPIGGEVIVDILQVNDPPTSEDFLHIAREDDFDLIGFEEHMYDNETSVVNLRIGIRGDDYSSTLQYLNDWITPVGASLRVYHAHQIITYEPPPEFVGTDSFTYSVCDLCDIRRDEELGRVDQEPHCARQIEENGGSRLFDGTDIFITCTENTVTVRVTNINDVPQARDISGTTQTRQSFTFTPFEDSLQLLPVYNETGYLYSDPNSAIFDSDDLQARIALERGDNLTLFNLQPTTDINEASLVLKSQGRYGVFTTATVDGRVQIEYTPNIDFQGGYDEVVYEICDNMIEDAPPRCAEAIARIFVTREGPSIIAVTADGLTSEDLFYSDSQVSAGDVIFIDFNYDTNIPPYGNTETVLLRTDIDQMFEFSDPYILESVSPNGYIGQWDSPTRLRITFTDVGYPQPFVFDAASRTYRELRIGEWTVTLRQHPGPCGGFDDSGQPVVVDRYCLLTADETAQPYNFTSPPLVGNFGLRLPELRNVFLESTTEDLRVLDTENIQEIFLQTHLVLRLVEPLSYAQLRYYCSIDPIDILSTASLADSMTLIVDGCANILRDGTYAHDKYADNIDLVMERFSVGRTRRSVEDLVRERRQTVTGQPVQSELKFRVLSVENPKINPITEPNLFYRTVAENLNYETIANVIFETLGILPSSLTGYKNTATPLVNPDDGFFYYANEEDETPQIIGVVADDPDNTDQVYGPGDTITITFDSDTDQPVVTTKEDIDLIFIFDPPLGVNYEGVWLDPRSVQITIREIDPESTNYPSAAIPGPQLFSVTFTPNYFHSGEPVTSDNEEFPNSMPSCIGINVCGYTTTDGSEVRSVGICDVNQRSCRAAERWASLDGDFGTGSPQPVAPFPWWYILIAIVVIVLIAVTVVIFYFMWRNHSQRAQRKEARRVLSRWKEDRGAPGKENRSRTETPKPWQGPPAPAVMRSLPDPFAKDGPMGKLPDVIRPPTAITEEERLPPIPQPPRSTFIPRTPARIHPAPPSLQSVPAPPHSRTLSSPATLQQLGLPPLTKAPLQQETPTRLDRRSVLPPVKGGLVSLQARRALATEQDTFGTGAGAGAAMPDRPARLPPLGGGAGLFGPTNMPDKPLHLAPITTGKGKAPLGGRPLPKKGVLGEEGEGNETQAKPSIPNLPTPLRPLPTVGQSKPLPGIGTQPRLSVGSPPSKPLPAGIGSPIKSLPGIRTPAPLGGPGSPPKPLPAISSRTPLPSLTSPTMGMPPRRIVPDPFAKALSPTTSGLGGLGSPSRATPAPLQFPPPRPLGGMPVRPLGGRVSTVGPLSPTSPSATKPQTDQTTPSPSQAQPKAESSAPVEAKDTSSTADATGDSGEQK